MLLILGNATIDESMEVEAWPSPGQTVLVGAPRRDLGGKGANQALVASRAGMDVRFVAAIGRDGNGDHIATMLAGVGLDPADLMRVDADTDRSMIFISREGENAIASTTDAARAIGSRQADAIAARLGSGDQLLMQGNLSVDATKAALASARRAGATTIFNPSPVHAEYAELLPSIDLLVLNEGEAAAISGRTCHEEAVAALREAGARTVVLTLGGKGAMFGSGEGTFHVPARPVRVVDTTGAGDTFMGVLVAAMFRDAMSPRAAIEAASAAAAITVQRKGTFTAFPSAAEIGAILRG
ncbi:ribokinase [Mesorhizobium comanense]|uniref:ribokinase n=1 Tax=Mesorhizobium comanense TaxID=2502215 RepID=UPI0022B703B8|nr:ribokinase [Mesorhizobium comanense]